MKGKEQEKEKRKNWLTKKFTLRNNQRGFTILEIIVVITMVGILSAVLYAQLKGREDSAKIQATESQMLRLWEAARIWRVNYGYYDYTNFGSFQTLLDNNLAVDKDQISAFGTDFNISKAGSNRGVVVTVNIPSTASNPENLCQQLAQRFVNKGYDPSKAVCSGTTVSVTFEE